MLTRRRVLAAAAAAPLAAAPACPAPPKDTARPTGAGDDTAPDSGPDTADTADTAPPGDTASVPPISSNEDFYVQSYSRDRTPDPAWADAWALTIGGLVDEAAYTLAELQALPAVEVEHTLECIGNRGSWAINNATWRGCTLRSALEARGVTLPAEASHLLFLCGDGYETSVPLTDLDAMLLVYEMNGAPLPIDHGAPIRVLTPGRYGMKNPKWITRIDVVDSSIPGTWERLGWSDDCTCHVHAWIHGPPITDPLPRSGFDLVGSAYAGAIPITSVEVSLDDGQTWAPAAIEYAPGANVWTLWRFRAVPAAAGPMLVKVRARAADGRVQSEQETADYDLDGFEGIQTVVYTIA